MKAKKYIFLILIFALAIGVVATFLILNNINATYFIVSFDTQGGTLLDDIKIRSGSKIKRPEDPFKNGYQIKDWKKDDLVWDFENFKVEEDFVLTAEWETKEYTINYDFDGGYTSEEYATSYNIESEFDLVRPDKSSNIFVGWFDENGKRFDSITPGLTGDLYLKAKYIDYLTIENTNPSKGTVVAYATTFEATEVLLKNIPVNNQFHLFKGWFDKNSVLLDGEHSFVIQLDPKQHTFIKSDYLNSSEEYSWNISHGVLPNVIDEHNMTYGFYPQTYVSDPNVVNKLNNLSPIKFFDFYYYNHEYYVKRKASIYEDEHGMLPVHNFDDSTEIVNGNEYWFKCDPLKWDVLANSSNQYLLITDKLLENVRFYENSLVRTIDDNIVYPNNYEYSDVRKWMNEDFYEKAFYFNNSFISKTIVANGPETTLFPENQYACNNTEDFVFTLSYKEMINPAYGFDVNPNSSSSRLALTTDYSRIDYTLYETVGSNLYCGYYWTRSPYCPEQETRYGLSCSRINRSGGVNYAWCGSNYSCVRPAINIVIS